ncbi:type III secretion system chaperone [Pseudomonas sp. C2L11]|nr:type III secretion system chaperone [Pseudomonas typographi]
MLRDSSQYLSGRPAPAPITRNHPTADMASGLPPLPTEAHPWLTAVAKTLGLTGRTAETFTRYGLLTVPSLNILMLCQQAEPARWSLLGFVQPPAGISTLLWSEALLRANCVAMALDTCVWGQDEKGVTVLAKQLPFYQYNDCQAVVEAIEQMEALSSSLLVTVVAAAQASTDAPEQPSSDMTPVSPQLDLLGQRLDSMAERAIDAQWHKPLIEQALTALKVALPGQAFGSVGALKVDKRFIEVIADPDERHLLLSTSVGVSISTAAQRSAALQTNLYLMTGAHCGLALAPGGATLQSRWDCTGLDGNDLAAWLADFMTLACALDAGDPPAAATHYRSAGGHN